MIDLQSAEDRSAAAGEYVLGTLSEADHAAFAAALQRDPALQAEVYAWQDRLLALSIQAAPAEPSAPLWQRIEGAVQATPLMPAAATPPMSPRSPGSPATTSVPTPVVPARHAGAGPWWQRLAPWQALSGVALAAALVLASALALVMSGRLVPWQADERYLAVLQSPNDRSTGWLVEIDAHRLRLVPVAGNPAVPDGRSLQFWTKPQGAAAPTSLGLVSAGQRAERPLAQLPAVGEQQLFEITLEPLGGSPLGRPTGPILYVGRTVHL